MKIIIAGAGAVGAHLAKLLVQENHDITLIDEERELLGFLGEQYNIFTYVGNCTGLSDLTEAAVSGSDLFVAVTPEESKNIISCMLASGLGAKKTLARIDNNEYLLPKNLKLFDRLGINSMIYPEIIAANETAMALKRPWVRFWWELCDEKVVIAGAKIKDNTSLVNRFLFDLVQEKKLFHIVAIKRNGNTIIPRGNDRILPNDILYFTILKKHQDILPGLVGKKSSETKKVMFVGGGHITMRTIEQLPQSIDIKVIEQDRERAKQLAEQTPSNVTVFVEDGRNSEFLVREGIAETDVFLALTANSEANILGCIMAKKYGVRKTIAEIENIDYISMAEKFDIDTIINKKLITAGKIHELLLKADATNIKSLTFADANVGEVIAKPGSKVTGKEIKNLNLPADITFGALIRDDEPMLVDGETIIEAGDRVVLFFLSSSLKSIENLFGK